MKTHCLIIDDEELARNVIKTHLEKFPTIEVVAECENALEAFSLLQKYTIDLLFLDIEMPEVTGIDFLKSLQRPPRVIFTTAYRKYAPEGFELDVVDYLLKPISLDRMMTAINKYYRSSNPVHNTDGSSSAGEGTSQNFIFLKEDRKMVKVDYDDILFIESLKDYVVIHTRNKKVVTKIGITELEDELPESSFIRIHRSYIVAIKNIDVYTPTSVEIGKRELTIGRSYKHNALAILKRYSRE